MENPEMEKIDEIDVPSKDVLIEDDDDDGDLNVGSLNEDFDDGIDGSDEEEEPFDSVCAICDNGGDLLCCDGMCLRSFHATEEAGSESDCVSLGFTAEEVEAIEMSSFFCKNCRDKKHQCFSCGRLGSSDENADPEVFRCVNATCGRFYHPHCVAKLLHRNDTLCAEILEDSISSGERFTCPIHKCHVCDKYEDKKDHDLQFAVCRRCPRSYHRKCLPRKIAFEDDEDEDIIQRAWEDLLPNRILIYCLKHEIDEELGTPVRDHIQFSSVKKKKLISASLWREKLSSRRSISEDDSASEKSLPKTLKRSDKPLPISKEVVRKVDIQPGSSLARAKKPGSSLAISSLKKVERSKIEDTGPSLGDRLYDVMFKGSGTVKPKKQYAEDTEVVKIKAVVSTKDPLTKPVVKLDANSEKKILEMIKEASSSVSLKQINDSHKPPSTYSTHYRGLDNSITQGKIDGSVQALLTALKKLDNGSSVEDAKAVCEPGVLQQMTRWKSKLVVYLAPFLHGMRYTSFGRHFTKVEKLKEIVDKLHWYVQDDDMIVDFCCGANDFSLMMKKKLEDVGKKCQFKNFDILKPKNDFNFEQRDWMTVKLNELPTGSKLIMGLNPPFGLKAALANQFVSKALTFRPKLVVLIVPPETERLDRKDPPYNLIWEDNATLSGKSFYLPGSLSTNHGQVEQWNSVPPVLLLWSRFDFTPHHTAIAHDRGHVSRIENLPGSRSQNRSKKMLSSLLPDPTPLKKPPTPPHPSPPSLPPSAKDGAGEGVKQHKTPISNSNNTSGDGGDSRDNKRARHGYPASETEADTDMGGFTDEPKKWRDLKRSAEEQKRWYGGGGMSPEGDTDEVNGRYALTGREAFGSDPTSHRWSSGSPADEGFGAQLGYPETAGGGNYRLGGGGAGGGTEERYGGRMGGYGLPGSAPQIAGSAFGPSLYGGPKYSGRAGGTTTTAMQRYAPQLDEMNHTHMGDMGGRGPGPGRYSDAYDRSYPHN